MGQHTVSVVTILVLSIFCFVAQCWNVTIYSNYIYFAICRLWMNVMNLNLYTCIWTQINVPKADVADHVWLTTGLEYSQASQVCFRQQVRWYLTLSWNKTVLDGGSFDSFNVSVKKSSCHFIFWKSNGPVTYVYMTNITLTWSDSFCILSTFTFGTSKCVTYHSYVDLYCNAVF